MKNTVKTIFFAVCTIVPLQNTNAAEYRGFLRNNTVYIALNLFPPVTVRVHKLLHFRPPSEGKTEEVIDLISILDDTSQKITSEKELALLIKALKRRMDGRFFLIKKEVEPQKIFDQDGKQVK